LAAVLSTRCCVDSAEARYSPKAFSDAGVMLLRAQSGDSNDQPYREVYADETFDWRSVAQDIAVIDVKGGHSSMLQRAFRRITGGGTHTESNCRQGYRLTVR
jgi:hypothetical protein